MCILTYHPSFELHYEVLTKLLALKRLKRMNLMMNQRAGSTYSLTSLSRMSKKSDEPDIEEIHLLGAYIKVTSLALGLNVTIPLSTVDPVNYTCPLLSQLDIEWCCPPFFSSVRFQDLFWLVCAVLLEKSVVFISSNTGLLTAAV
jgi:hypothetical protein